MAVFAKVAIPIGVLQFVSLTAAEATRRRIIDVMTVFLGSSEFLWEIFVHSPEGLHRSQMTLTQSIHI